MLKFIKSFFAKKQAAVAEVPYKVEVAPVVEPTLVAVQATEAMVESVAPAKKPRKPKAEKAPAVKKPRAPKTPKVV